MRINNVVVFTQHAESASQADVAEAVKKNSSSGLYWNPPGI